MVLLDPLRGRELSLHIVPTVLLALLALGYGATWLIRRIRPTVSAALRPISSAGRRLFDAHGGQADSVPTRRRWRFGKPGDFGAGWQLGAALAGYGACAILFFGRSLSYDFSARYIGRGADPTVMMWMFEWWPFAVAHHLNLFLTDFVWAPVGFNLASMTSIPLLAAIAYPLTRTLGLVSAYNVMALMAPVMAAFGAYVLCRQITGKFWPSLFGGYVFGFSAYMLGQLLGHLCLTMVFAVPLAAAIVVARVQRKLRPASFVALLALALSAQFLIDMEFFATGVLFGAFMLAALIYYSQPDDRRRLCAEIPLIGAGVLAAVAIVSPYIYYFLAFSPLQQPFWSPSVYSTDLLNFVIPTPTNLFGANDWLGSISSHFPAHVMEQGGYIAAPVFVMLILLARRHWHQPWCKALLTVIFAGCIATLGPVLHIGGSAKALLPWLAVARLPLLEHVLPARLMVMVSLLLAVVVAVWIAESEVATKVRTVAALLTVAMMLPNPSAAYWSAPLRNPRFFTDGTFSKYFSPADVVLTLPWGGRGSAMLWQAECGMCFRNVAGWTGVARFSVRRWPIVDYFMGAFDLDDVDTQFKAFLANTNVSVVLIADGAVDAARWNALAKSLGVPRIDVGGVSLYRIPPTLLDRYRGLSGLEMEARADRTRFETAADAVDEYLKSGGRMRQLSVERLVDLSFLPENWRHTEKWNLIDLFVQPLDDRHVVIGEIGSFSAMRGIIDAYRKDASAIYYPLPEKWEPATPPWRIRFLRAFLTPVTGSSVDGESMRILGISFTRAQLDKATSSPPS